MARKKRRSSQYRQSSQIIDMESARQERLDRREEARAEAELREKRAEERRRKRRLSYRKKKKRRSILTIIIAGIVIMTVGMSIARILVLEVKHSQLSRENAALVEEREYKEKKLKKASSEETIEEQARNWLKLIKPGETVYIPESERYGR